MRTGGDIRAWNATGALAVFNTVRVSIKASAADRLLTARKCLPRFLLFLACMPSGFK
jgi:hypothetical protein